MSSRQTSMLRLLLRHELRSVLRDRRALVLSVLVPLLMMPLMLSIVRFTEQRRDEAERARELTYATVGEERAWLQATLEIGLAADAERRAAAIDEIEVDDAAQALADQRIDAWLDVRHEGSQRTVELHFRATRERSRNAADTLSDALLAARSIARDELLTERGMATPSAQWVVVQAEDIATQKRSTGSALGKFLCVALVLLMMTGGQVVAADIMAGEKERGTLETLITTAADRQTIVLAKLLTIAGVATLITVINILNLLLYLTFGLLPGSSAALESLPVSAVLAIALLFLPVALLLSALLLLISGYARSFKEAQLIAFPLQLLLLVPALASVLPTIELRSAVAMVPIANVSVAARDVLLGSFDWPFIFLTVLVNLALAVALGRHVGKALDEERLVTPEAHDSIEAERGPRAFEHHVVRWVFAVWAVLIIVAANDIVRDVRGQLAINLLVLMLGSSLWMVRRYRLDIRQAWALRKPPLIAWPLVLVGVPAGLVAAQGAFELSALVLPVPESALEQFEASLLPDDIPTWQLVLFLTVLPGICEEIFFRGMLLHGLRRRLRPVALAVVVGLCFGFFHIALFRLVPTAFLGILFTALTLLTRSIFPAMLWHALNNLLGVGLATAGLAPTGFPPWSFALAIACLLVVFGLLWRYRTPYPELRLSRRPKAATASAPA